MILMTIDERISAFQKRIETEPEYCLELFELATVQLMSAKYAYYVKSNPYIDDLGYDITEKSWYVMGRALGILDEDVTSPCIDWDETHPMAEKGIELYKRLKRK